jgi:PIN domain nuclease of toxin-antitoxin system
VKRYLLDTCVLLWAVREPKRLSRTARRILDSDAELLFSPASAWEIIAKSSKLRLSGRAGEWVRTHRQELGLEWLPIYGQDILLLDSLPWLHNDPFDRILVCQSIAEDVTLLTPDLDIQRYEAKTIW